VSLDTASRVVPARLVQSGTTSWSLGPSEWFGSPILSSVASLVPRRLHIASALSAHAYSRNVNVNPTTLHNLTYTLILHPIAGFLALLAFLMGLIGIAAASRFSTIMMAIFAFFAAVVTLVVFVIDMVIWNIVRNRLHEAGFGASLVSDPSLICHLVADCIGPRQLAHRCCFRFARPWLLHFAVRCLRTIRDWPSRRREGEPSPPTAKDQR